jgi:hypothetical protein
VHIYFFQKKAGTNGVTRSDGSKGDAGGSAHPLAKKKGDYNNIYMYMLPNTSIHDLESDEFLKLFKHNKRVFKHELIHVYDFKRSKNKRRKSDKYHGNDWERNAYFQDMISLVNKTIKDAALDFEALHTLHQWQERFENFRQAMHQTNSWKLIDDLDKKDKRKLTVRMKQYWLKYIKNLDIDKIGRRRKK